MGRAMQNGAVHYQSYVAGWMDGSIVDFLALLPATSDGIAYALITCLDSNRDPALLIKKNTGILPALTGAKPFKHGLLMPCKLLQSRSLRERLFVGFDEIWLFPNDDIEPKPESLSIVGPSRINQAKLDRIGKWMAKNNCSLALGDGAGLNIIVKAHGLMRSLLTQSIRQPDPTGRLARRWIEDEEKPQAPKKSGKYQTVR